VTGFALGICTVVVRGCIATVAFVTSASATPSITRWGENWIASQACALPDWHNLPNDLAGGREVTYKVVARKIRRVPFAFRAVGLAIRYNRLAGGLAAKIAPWHFPVKMPRMQRTH
jgi:hypothetical protein